MMESRHCSEPGCQRPIVAKEKCASHYQRDRRQAQGHKNVDPVRDYGKGSNQVSGRINDEIFAKLQAEAQRKFDGKLYRLVQQVLHDYAQSL
jgi:hypothetical protein